VADKTPDSKDVNQADSKKDGKLAAWLGFVSATVAVLVTALNTLWINHIQSSLQAKQQELEGKRDKIGSL
jgi:hypothetical protein